MTKVIKLSHLGFNLSSRLMARHMWKTQKLAQCEQNLEFNFEGVKFMSLSFATELVDSCFKIEKEIIISFINLSTSNYERVFFATENPGNVTVNLPKKEFHFYMAD